MKDLKELHKPEVGASMYKWEVVSLVVAVIIPFASWFGWSDGAMFARSGSLMVFFAVLAEFMLLNKANIKHIRNAQRAIEGVQPNNFSKAATLIGFASLILALFGTVIWGYGDLFK